MGQSFLLEDVVDVPAVPEFPYRLVLGTGEIHGRVVERASDRILARSVLVAEIERDGACVFAGRTIADGEGRYAMRSLPRGVYRISAYATTGCFGPESRDGLSIDAPDRTLDADIALAPGAALTLKVTDKDGRPMHEAAVTVSDESGRRIQFTPEDLTDARGSFAINGIRPGRWRIGVAHDGCAPKTSTIDLAVGDASTIEIILSPATPR
jgi:hypothetical protein